MGSGNSTFRTTEEQMHMQQREYEKIEQKRQEMEKEACRESRKYELDKLKLIKTHESEDAKVRTQLMNELDLKKIELEDKRLLASQKLIYEILKSKAQNVQEVTYGAAILAAIQSGAPLEKEVYLGIMAKVPASIAPKFKLDNAILRACEDEDDGVMGPDLQVTKSFTDY